MPEITDSVDWSQIFEALTHDYRRQTLRYLAAVDGEAGVEAVVDHLVDSGDLKTDATRDYTLVQLYHRHLPKLTDVGLVRWDGTESAVSLTPLALELSVGLLSPDPMVRRSAAGPQRAGD